MSGYHFLFVPLPPPDFFRDLAIKSLSSAKPY